MSNKSKRSLTRATVLMCPECGAELTHQQANDMVPCGCGVVIGDSYARPAYGHYAPDVSGEEHDALLAVQAAAAEFCLLDNMHQRSSTHAVQLRAALDAHHRVTRNKTEPCRCGHVTDCKECHDRELNTEG